MQLWQFNGRSEGNNTVTYKINTNNDSRCVNPVTEHESSKSKDATMATQWAL
jgi:hypothetical protein